MSNWPTNEDDGNPGNSPYLTVERSCGYEEVGVEPKVPGSAGAPFFTALALAGKEQSTLPGHVFKASQ